MGETEGVTYVLRPEQEAPATCEHPMAVTYPDGRCICHSCDLQLREPVDVRALENRVAALEAQIRELNPGLPPPEPRP